MREKAEILLQKIYPAFIGITSFMFCLEGLFSGYVKYLYAGAALLSLVFGAAAFLYSKMYGKSEVYPMLLLILWAFLSGYAVYGFSVHIFLSQVVCVLVIRYALYLCVIACEKPERMLALFSDITIAVLTAVLCNVFVHATASVIIDGYKGDNINGCFRVGRLWGLSNANILAFACVTAALLSVHRLLCEGRRVRKAIYTFTALFALLCLGLTNSRACIVAVVISVFLLTFDICIHINERYAEIQWICRSKLRHIFISGIASAAVSLLVLGGIYGAPSLYGQALRGVSAMTRDAGLRERVDNIYSRSINDAETMSDRYLIWKKTLAEVMSSKRLALFGITPTGNTLITGVYDSFHDIEVDHAHSTYLEFLRIFGIPGFLIGVWIVISVAIRILKAFKRKKYKLSERYLLAVLLAYMIIGLIEQIPFSGSFFLYAGIPFVVICACLVRLGDSE